MAFLSRNDTFEDYCRERWETSRIHAHRMIEASDVEAMLPIGNKPKTESQCRPLAALLKLGQQVVSEVWSKAIETSSDGTNGKPKLTAKHVGQSQVVV